MFSFHRRYRPGATDCWQICSKLNRHCRVRTYRVMPRHRSAVQLQYSRPMITATDISRCKPTHIINIQIIISVLPDMSVPRINREFQTPFSSQICRIHRRVLTWLHAPNGVFISTINQFIFGSRYLASRPDNES